MICAIWYHLYNLKNLKSIHEGALLLLNVALLHGCFSLFNNCTNGTRWRKASHIIQATESLERATVEFSGTQLKANPNKCHLITGKSQRTLINAENNPINNSEREKLFGGKI